MDFCGNCRQLPLHISIPLLQFQLLDVLKKWAHAARLNLNRLWVQAADDGRRRRRALEV